MTAGAVAKKRLYFGLWPTEEIREAIVSGAARAIEGTGQRGAVPPQNYHITLAFLGSVSASGVSELAAVARQVRFLPFDIALERTGYWPRSQVGWVAPAEPPARLLALVDDLWNKLTDLGYLRENRPYMPHVTIGRKVGGGFGTQLPLPVNWPVSSFVLVESATRAEGPVYTVLEEFFAGD